MSPNRTGTTLRRYRLARQLSLRDLAGALFCDHTWVLAIEAGRRWPNNRGWVEDADLLLCAGGELVASWDADQAERARAEDTMRMLKEARQGSEELILAPDGVALDDIGQRIVDISTKARLESYDETLKRALGIRAELTRRLRVGAHSPNEIRDLYVALGRVCGVLSYLTLDLGQHDHAKVHAEAAFQLGDRAGHDQLRAWARGTQALAFRFTKDFELARGAAEDGLNYVGRSTGTTEPRLLCGLAASVANLGDSTLALELLEQADRVRDHCRPDEIPGLFTFTPAKQIYYHGFSLMWADDSKTLTKSITASEDALRAWKVQRSPGDEMLTTIYLAMANARVGDLDASLAAVSPVLEQPIEAHFSWVRKRLNQLDGLLAKHFPDSKDAQEERETLRAYVHAA
ncbi:helix-turn-helix domain-containing protein [Nocardia terpenica]|uniref:helix-turn-helix domain-containing protein n=1 Tax=Nocardia terpenica TaxID=455432 RepID=UPI00082C893B|nr:helix-turn-helix transcriptional regulator [Nocardia terpenica]NQE88079.1 helix-turn-helix domain-containing protein [Nocardia terpenica]